MGAFSCLDLGKNGGNLSEKWPLVPRPSSLLAPIDPSGAPMPLLEAPYRRLWKSPFKKPLVEASQRSTLCRSPLTAPFWRPKDLLEGPGRVPREVMNQWSPSLPWTLGSPGSQVGPGSQEGPARERGPGSPRKVQGAPGGSSGPPLAFSGLSGIPWAFWASWGFLSFPKLFPFFGLRKN